MGVAAKLDEFGRPAWVALAILTFLVWWPLGLAALAFAFGSGRMTWGGCGVRGGGRFDRWESVAGGEARRAWRRAARAAGGTSGNRAFDEYRAETLRRLEEEEREFRGFLERLRQAKDKAEFDEFMAERRRGAAGGPAAPVADAG